MSNKFRKLVKKVRAQGWVVEKTKNNHFKFIPPTEDQRLVFTGGTPSDKRAFQNLVSDLKREGFKDG